MIGVLFQQLPQPVDEHRLLGVQQRASLLELSESHPSRGEMRAAPAVRTWVSQPHQQASAGSSSEARAGERLHRHLEAAADGAQHRVLGHDPDLRFTLRGSLVIDFLSMSVSPEVGSR